jgi:hypothetical protein
MTHKSPLALGFALVFCFGLANPAHAQSPCQSPSQCQSLAEPLKTVIPVFLNVATGDITVGTTTYPGGNPGVHLLALNRKPDNNHLDSPDLVGNQTFTDAGSANTFLQNALNDTQNHDTLLILNAVGNYGFGLSQIAKNLEQFGSATDIEGVSTAIPFVFVGNGGLNVAGAHQSGYSNQNMSGYLATDYNGNYTFIQTDYVKYDLIVNGEGTGQDGTISIGANSYTVAGSGKLPICTGSNGFHVVAVNREVPGNVIGNESYCTAQSDSEITHLITDLSNLVGSESNLVLIASFGHPIPSNWGFDLDGDARIFPLARLIAELGGYWETMVYLTPNDTFSLVGATAPPAGTPGARKRARESSSVYPDNRTGELHGVLARGLRGSWYSPLNADYKGLANLGLYEILGLPPTSFPHPANAAELTAFQQIATQLCGSGCNPRNQYADTNIDIGNYLNQLESMQDPQNGNCSNPTNSGTSVCNMRQQLITEFKYVSDIRLFNQNLQTVWAGSGTLSVTSMLGAYNTIENSVQAPTSNAASSIIEPLYNAFLSLGSLASDVGPIFGVVDTGFNLATSLVTDQNGNPTSTLTTTVGQLQRQAGDHFTAELQTLGTQFNFIYQDWGRMSALGTNLAGATQGSAWFWDGDTTTANILKAMNPSILRSYYQSLMPAAYAIGSYVPQCYQCFGFPNWGSTPLWQQPRSYTAFDGDLSTCGGPPFNQDSCSAEPFNFPWYVPYTFPTDTTNPYSALGNGTNTLLADGGWLGIGNLNTPSDPGSYGLYQPPASTLLGYLFTPLSGNPAGLGVYPPEFFEGWSFPRVTCGYSDDGTGNPGPGCNWASATAPPTNLPGLSIGLSIQAGSVARSGTQLGIPLTITNKSSLSTNSVQITHLGVRTVPGSDEIRLESPSLPREIGVLAPGATTTITVHLNVPSEVKKISLTENGTVQIGNLVPYKFSFGQVIFPSSKK